ncbi:hypothetical protein B5F40_09395 [Gordonibacter sp. An230]|uniref:helix-turn-helix domain-containing protein n=1 Tax=Gordonibacter sp. An230 TaxID=1965592 RepID=UPI000B562E6C|nr:helix-turn-helix transcriptional regulator [Gordonibacter sp. An230]OUO89881.1 hypothetical protein B5F40_09395 [Gordonibacter sp. An230]
MLRKVSRAFDAYSVGFAIYLTLSSTSAWGLLRIASMTSVSFSGMDGVETVRSIGYIGVLLAFGLGCLCFPSQCKRDTTYHSTVCLTLGYVGLFATVVVRNAALQNLSAFLVGAGSSLSFVMWQRLFSEQDADIASRRIVAGSALSAVLYLVVACIASYWLYAIAVLGIVALNALFLRRCRGGVFRRDSSGIVVGQSGGATLANIVSSTWRYMLCIAAIGYVGGVSRMFAQQSGSDSSVLNVTLALGMLVAAGGLALMWDKVHGRLSFPAVYAAVFLAVMTGFLFLPFFDAGYRMLFAGVANAAFSLVSIFMMITCIKIAHLRQVDPIAVFGVFSSIVYGGVLIGRAVGDALGQTYDVSQILVIALMSTYVLSFAGVVVNLRRREKADRAFDPIGGDVESEPEGAVPSVGDGGSAVRPSGGHSAPRPLVRNVIVAQDMVPVYSRLLKKTYGLSNRETDVLELIMRGRDVARMAETLFVSENTVRSHCKNLYRKLDVHNRQQVFDLVEEFRKREEYDGD